MNQKKHIFTTKIHAVTILKVNDFELTITLEHKGFVEYTFMGLYSQARQQWFILEDGFKPEFVFTANSFAEIKSKLQTLIR